ncbi:MAG TPA: DUF5947 family protein [Polyangia bacterium]
MRALAPFARRAHARRENHARCELCGAAVGERHAHVVEIAQHSLMCACSACAVLFRDGGGSGGRYRTVPDRVVVASVAARDEAGWARLEIPVRLAFVVRRDRYIAFYPSPAGPVEAPLSDAAAAALAALVPSAATLEPEVEALLFQRSPAGETRAFVVPLDACYELVGLVRRHWRGFDGGDEARAAIDAFLARLAAVAEKGHP